MASPTRDDVPEMTEVRHTTTRAEDEDATVWGEIKYPLRENFPHLQSEVSHDRSNIRVRSSMDGAESMSNMRSPSRAREATQRLEDDLEMLQVERRVSQEASNLETQSLARTRSTRDRTRRPDPVVDEFDLPTNPILERTQIFSPPEPPENKLGKFMRKVHASSFLIRYFTYIIPVTLIILIPLLIGALVRPVRRAQPNVGGVKLVWFCIWLEIVWLSLWASRIVAKLLPVPVGLLISLFTNNFKTYRDMTKQLEIAATLFFWQLAVEISFLPLMRNHQVEGGDETTGWTKTMNKVLISFLVLAILNLVEKIIIQLLAISFHRRSYKERIELNKFQIGSLTKLYRYSKVKIAMEDSDFEESKGEDVDHSGTRTPAVLEKATKVTKQGFSKFGDMAGRIAGDFTGKVIRDSTHPYLVVLNLLRTTKGSQVLARRLFRTFAREETETVFQEDLTSAFDNEEEADAAFAMFDKDLNGDISMQELEAVCTEIGLERKSITASLKDLTSVVGKFDNVLTFLVFVAGVLVFISLISTSAAGVLTSLGSSVLALSWLFSATAQEFLQSCVFVFVKHPFDVGDRVTIYGNAGAELKGDDFLVKEVSLLYTEFQKLPGHVVQAPNSYLNTLFILNQRRSGSLAEAIPMVFKYGTTLDQIEALRNRLLEFVKAEKREYQPSVITELRDISEVHSITVSYIFFYKSNWQNESLRLSRRNQFVCAMMVAMQELGIEGPRMRFPGQRENFPLYMQNMPYNEQFFGKGGTPDDPMGSIPQAGQDNMSARGPEQMYMQENPSMYRSQTRGRGESLAAMGRRMDFSLGMTSMPGGDIIAGDVYADREHPAARQRVLSSVSASSQSRYRGSSVAQSSARSARPETGQLKHRVTAPAGRTSTSSVHRNRFFSRRSQEGATRMEMGMAGIPEAGDGSGDRAVDKRLDPRTGVIGRTAVRRSSDVRSSLTSQRAPTDHRDSEKKEFLELPKEELGTNKAE